MTVAAPGALRVQVVAGRPVRPGVVSALLCAGLIVLPEARDEVSALALARVLHPDVAVLDPAAAAGLPGAGLAAASPHTRVLVLAGGPVAPALLGGVGHGQVDEAAPPGELVAAVRCVAAGGAPLPAAATMDLVRRFRALSGSQRPPGGHGRLTGRERDVLAEVARGCTNEQIARALGVSPNTVKTHLARALLKLEVTGRSAAVCRAVELGQLADGLLVATS